jgi:exosortase/archaeosortase family protein
MGIPGESHHRAGFGGWVERIPGSMMILLASSPVVSWFIKRLNDGSDEPLGLLVLALALCMAWWDRHAHHASARAKTTGALLVLSSVLLIGTLPPMLRATLAIAGTGFWFGLHRKPGLLGLFVLSLPVISSLQFYAGYPMRLATAEGTVRLLELGGAVVVRSGVNIELGGVPIGVDPACSGIRMLWHALAAAMALAALHRVSWNATIACGLLALFLCIPANVFRASWLVLQESGHIAAYGPGHGAIGLICFTMVLIPLWALLSRWPRSAIPVICGATPSRVDRAILLASAVLVPFMMALPAEASRTSIETTNPTEFSFNGIVLPLQPLPASSEEQAFAQSFPGNLSSHRWGDKQVILRQVTRATRKLHPSRDCLRAAGYETTESITVRCDDGSTWSKFVATKDGRRLIVHERITSSQDASTWTDIPAWYWSAIRHPLNGPWRAETVISP